MHELEFRPRNDKTNLTHQHEISAIPPVDSLKTNILLQRLLQFGDKPTVNNSNQRGLKPKTSFMEHLKSKVKAVEQHGNKAKEAGVLGVTTGKPLLKAKPILDSTRNADRGGGDVGGSGKGTESKRVSVHREALGKFLKDLCDSENEGSVGGRGMGGEEKKTMEEETKKLLDEKMREKELITKEFGNDAAKSSQNDLEGQGNKHCVHGSRRTDKERAQLIQDDNVAVRLKRSVAKDIPNNEMDQDRAKLKVKLIPEDKNGKIYSLGTKLNTPKEPIKPCLRKDVMLKNASVIRDSEKDGDEKEVPPGVSLASKTSKCDEETRKIRKVSFKVNKTMSSRRKPVECRVVLNSSVANLATRFNSLVETPGDDKTPLAELMTPSSAQKKDIKVIVSRRNSTKRDGSGVKKPDDVCIFDEKRSNISITYRPSNLRTRPASVKAAIQLFEQNSGGDAKTPIKTKDAVKYVEPRKTFGKADKSDENLVESRKTFIDERVKNMTRNQKAVGIQEGKDEKISNDRGNPLKFIENRIEMRTSGIKNSSSMKANTDEQNVTNSPKTALKYSGCAKSKVYGTPRVQNDMEETSSIKKAVTFQTEIVYTDVVDNSKASLLIPNVKDDGVAKPVSSVTEGLTGREVKSLRSVKGACHDLGGKDCATISATAQEEPRKGQSKAARNTGIKTVSDSNKVTSSVTANGVKLISCDNLKVTSSSGHINSNIRESSSDSGIIYKSCESSDWSQLKSVGPKNDNMKSSDSITKPNSGIGITVKDHSVVNRSGSGVKYGGIKVLPNKSSLFSLLDKGCDLIPRDAGCDAGVKSVSGTGETPKIVTQCKLDGKDGSLECVNGNLHTNLEQVAVKGKQVDDNAYEEVGIYTKTKTLLTATATASKIAGLAKLMKSFPKYTSKHQKPELKVDTAPSDAIPETVAPSIETIKPNNSFLWGAIDIKSKVPQLPDIELTSDQEDQYDDIYPPEFYGYIDDENIYDDVGNLIDDDDEETDNGSLRVSAVDNTPLGYEYVSSRINYHADNNIYDDVKSMKGDRSMKDDTISVSNCYESIYDGDEIKGAVKYDSGGSTASTKSFCELNNSLYAGEGPGFHSSSVSQASTASVEELPQFEHHAASDSSATSDEWMDLEVSDGEMEAGTLNVVVHDRARCRRSPSWAQRVRRQWSSRTPRSHISGADSSESDTDHHYEMLYEVIGQTTGDIPFDDFDSDNSDDTRPTQPRSLDGYNASLPPEPPAQNVYAISKMAEAAGNKLLKIRKSLSRMRQKRHTTEIRLTQPLSLPSPPLPPSSPLPLPPLPRPPMEKSASSRNLPNRKYWSLRKFKRSNSANIETSTFYLTDTVDADSGAVENNSPRRLSDAETSAPQYLEVGSDNGVNGSKSSLSSATSERRSSIRPNSPPPLPPVDPPKRPHRKDKRTQGPGQGLTSTTSWYAECGLFDVNSSSGENRRTRSNTWYADIGLWNQNQARSQQDLSHLSQPDSSQPSLTSMSQHSLTDTSLTSQPDVSLTNTSQHSLTESSQMNSDETNDWSERSSCVEQRFTDEPLYQFYTAAVVELARRGMTGELDSDNYEEVSEDKVHYSRPTAMELIPTHGQHRTLWCEIPEVINSCIMNSLTTHQRKLQEAKFEIISSEASYIKSLCVLEEHFMASAEFNDETVLSKSDRRILFGNVAPVKVVSQKFLADLEKCWQDNVLLSDICDVVYDHATHNFNPYVKYCSNQIYLDRTLRRLKEQHSKFAEVLANLESSRMCQSLSLHSFLMLPMQRITRLPLLVDAMLTRLSKDDDEYHNCTLALARLNKVVKACNEGARKMERMEEILILSHQLDFPKEVKAIPIISSSRWLVRSGELTQLTWRGDGEGKLTFGKKFTKTTLHVFLFTDLLIVTKKKSEDNYCVIDYCPRNLVQLSTVEGLTHLPVKFLADGGRNIMLLTLLHNHEKKTVEMVLSCSLDSDRQRWMQAMSQPMSANPEESVYEHWDCPQVATLHQFVASQPDELALDVADVVNVLRKTPDGWYYGQRIRDGETGWFPGNYATEIASAHVRAKNLKLRYRLLALSGNFLDSQRKEKK